MTNEQRTGALIKKYGFDFSEIPKKEISELIEKEISDFHEGSSEYIRSREEIVKSFIAYYQNF